MTNLCNSFLNSAHKFPNNKCLGTFDSSSKSYTWLTYQQAYDRITNIAYNMQLNGVEKGDRVGIFSKNCVEWMLTMQTCKLMGYVCVPLYKAFEREIVKHILRQSRVTTIFIDFALLQNIVDVITCENLTIKHVICWNYHNNDEILKKTITDFGISLHDFDSFQTKHSCDKFVFDHIDESSICTLVFTPEANCVIKYATITHEKLWNIICTLLQAFAFAGVVFTQHERLISYLPLAQMFERTMEEIVISAGGAIGYWRGELHKLNEDIKAVRPTVFVGVPRVYDQIKTEVMMNVEKYRLKRSLYKYVMRTCRRNVGHSCLAKLNMCINMILFKCVRNKFGGKIRLCISDGNPMDFETEIIIKTIFGCEFIQGYGLTSLCVACFEDFDEGKPIFFRKIL